jgi:hypothetical protein
LNLLKVKPGMIFMAKKVGACGVSLVTFVLLFHFLGMVITPPPSFPFALIGFGVGIGVYVVYAVIRAWMDHQVISGNSQPSQQVMSSDYRIEIPSVVIADHILDYFVNKERYVYEPEPYGASSFSCTVVNARKRIKIRFSLFKQGQGSTESTQMHMEVLVNEKTDQSSLINTMKSWIQILKRYNITEGSDTTKRCLTCKAKIGVDLDECPYCHKKAFE